MTKKQFSKNNGEEFEEDYIEKSDLTLTELVITRATQLRFNILLDESQRLAAAVFEHTQEAITIITPEPKVLMVNNAFCKITGYTPIDVMGQSPRFLRSDKHDDDFYKNIWETLNEKGDWAGELWIRRKSGEIFPEWLTANALRDENNNITHFILVFTDISSLKHREERLKELAYYDALTKLPNRRLFEELLQQAIKRAKRDKTAIALLFIDMDHFKDVNDSLGHDYGDMLLISVSNRLKSTLRESDTVARLGGDEFTVILESVHNNDDAQIIAQKLLQELEPSHNLNGHEIISHASIGIALYPDTAETPSELIKAADQAMYLAKKAGRNNYKFSE